MPAPKTPTVAVDVIIELDGRLLLIERKHAPHGWALPGGFVDLGEAPARAAVREAREETSLDVELIAQLHAYGAPDRDPRGHTVAVVYVARARPGAVPQAADDARNLATFALDALPPLAFDHARIIADYQRWKADGTHPGAEV
jgi:ADP-ribose pyrophosphatase YjhB (NUDIX family)